MASEYRHTQVGWLVIIPAVPVAVMVVAFTVGSLPAVGGIIAAAILAVLLLFTTLTVTVDDERLVAAFTIGLIRRRIDLSEVRTFRRVQNPWYYGWGIRLIPGGTMFNVSGLSAVELVFHDGRRFRVGTDEPDALLAALVAARGEPAPLSPEENAQASSRALAGVVVLVVLLLALSAGIGVAILRGQRPPEVRVTNDALVVKGTFTDHVYAFDEMTSVTLEARLPTIQARTHGFAAGRSRRGWFRLAEWGEGQLYLDLGHPPYLVVKLSEGFVVVGYEDSERTRTLFTELEAARAR